MAAVEVVVETLKGLSKAVTTPEEIAQVILGFRFSVHRTKELFTTYLESLYRKMYHGETYLSC